MVLLKNTLGNVPTLECRIQNDYVVKRYYCEEVFFIILYVFKLLKYYFFIID